MLSGGRLHQLRRLARAPVGTYQYPDESATLVVGCALGAGRELRLSGPGVPGRGVGAKAPSSSSHAPASPATTIAPRASSGAVA